MQKLRVYSRRHRRTVVIPELERLLKHLLMSIHRINWYNNVMFAVSMGAS